MLIDHLVSEFENPQCILGLLLPNETIVAQREIIATGSLAGWLARSLTHSLM